ncbi:aminotransferase class I/II-fold pyridoxal phosphate-dependent enzyme [Limosilactobacillus difficilis]|uniref:aminotransferase class I/II-fold pyridoxal phosphate-dependent enzyme n=1 Tax=Limosilactobacillus difficilis TaxID=2991838 RepID=UPI0024BAF6EF|nr:aminotransferase class I/II-fold pyridoxal phosphate-dependent enzyme [Limosilactobacillus difficilis]
MPKAKPSVAARFNQNIKTVQPTGIREFDAQCSAIPDIIKLTIGEPDFNVPDAMKQAAIDAINNNDSHYAPAVGSEKMRLAASHFLKDRYGLDYDPDSEIAITIGASEGIFTALGGYTNPGDVVLIPTPTFPMYMAITQFFGGQAVELDTSADDFILTPAKLQAALDQYGDRVKALVLNYPSNPTGVSYSAEQIKALADVLKGTDVLVIADEIYSELVYDGKHTSIAKYIPEQTIVLNGVSKSSAMTGYRIGVLAGPAQLVKPVFLAHSLDVTAAADPSMAAAAAGMDTPAGREATAKMRDEYKRRRDFLAPALQKLGFGLTKPVGAFYIFAKIPANQNQDDVAFATALAKEAHVATTPGSFFGAGGKGYLRISYAASMANIKESVQRITAFLQK